MTQRHELEAWLGPAADELTKEQIDELLRIDAKLSERYADQLADDDHEEHQAAMTAAVRLMSEDPESVAADLADDLLRARRSQARATAAVQQAATMLIDPDAGKGARGLASQGGFASFMGVDRMTVRQWLGRN